MPRRMRLRRRSPLPPFTGLYLPRYLYPPVQYLPRVYEPNFGQEERAEEEEKKENTAQTYIAQQYLPFGPYTPFPRATPGYRRISYAIAYGDLERAYFGLGPCGELAYQLYKRSKEKGVKK